MKAFLMAAALENRAVEPEQRFDCENGSFRVPGSVIHDSHPHEELTVTEILRVSSNIGAVKIAFALGPRAHFESLRDFGFGRVTGVGFPGESSGLLRPWQQWRQLDHATIAFGQGVTVTPIQLAAATATLANGGEWVQPRLVTARRAPGGNWQLTRPGERRRVVQPETAAQVLDMMEGVVGPEGTARLAALRDVRVAGKTGTAQKLDAETGRYAADRFMAWFIGIVPADDPKLVIVVGIDEAQRPRHTGGAAAGPLFARMASAQLARFGIVTEPESASPRYNPAIESAPPMLVAATSSAEPEEIDSAVAESIAPAVSAPPVAVTAVIASPPPRADVPDTITPVVSLGDRMLLPDFRGMTPAQVLDITARTPLDVKMTGSGRAVTQEPAAGTILASRQALVFIHFEAPEAGRGKGSGGI
jgi:cell division protein FtsI (penicillin-binding protein 3)